MKKQYVKYILSLLLFGSNGIVASFVISGAVISNFSFQKRKNL